MAKIFVKNTTAGTKTWAGQSISAGAYYEIVEREQEHWRNNPKVISDVADGTLIVAKTATVGGEISNPTLGKLWLDTDHRVGFEGKVFNLDDNISIVSGSIVPDQTVVTDAPVGSRYFRSNNEVYRKIGTGDLASDWELITNGSGECQLHFLRKENCGRELIWEVINASDVGNYDVSDCDDVFLTCINTTVSYNADCELIITT